MRLVIVLCVLGLLVGGSTAVIASCASGSSTESDPGYDAGAPGEPCTEPGAVESCYPGPPVTRDVGECKAGSRTCVVDEWTACIGYVGPTDETCDGLDHNCNGTADESCPCNPGDTRPCYKGPTATRNLGRCKDGVQKCVDQVMSDTCEGQVLPEDEVCDEQDHNCNGTLDEGCHCLDGGVGGDCTTGTDLGNVTVGGSVQGPVSQVHLPTESQWYSVSFPPTGPATAGGGKPHVSFVLNTAEVYALEIIAPDCAGSPTSCEEDAGTASGITDWTFTDDQSVAGAGAWSTRNVPWPATVHVRVFRAGTAAGCDNYQLSVTR